MPVFAPPFGGHCASRPGKLIDEQEMDARLEQMLRS